MFVVVVAVVVVLRVVVAVVVVVLVAEWVVDPFGSNRFQHWQALGHRRVLPLVLRAPDCHGC